MKRLATALALLLALPLGACNGPHRRDALTDGFVIAGSGSLPAAMAGARAFALHPSARLALPVPGRPPAELSAVADAALVEVFRGRGYELVAPEEADVLVAYGIGADGPMTDDAMVKIFGVSPGVDLVSGDGAGHRGGIALAVVDARTRTVLWRGGTSAPFDPGATQSAEEASEGIRRAFGQLLADLPRAARR